MDFYLTTGIILASLALFAFYYLRRTMNKNVNFINEEEFTAGMRKGQLIDIRKKDAFDAGHINGARNLPLVQLTRNYNRLRQDQAVYLVCDNGKMCRRASTMLVSNGFENVYSLQGGIATWTKPLKNKK